MKTIIKEGEIKGIRFFYRTDNSDLKTFKEVLGQNTYERKNFKIESGEKWYDLGGNVGAFTLLACFKGANVRVYEPDPNCCKMIEKNLQLNGFNAEIINKALVSDKRKDAVLYSGLNKSSWRNSLEKNWMGNNKGRIVECLNFDEEVEDDVCVKMDIEGSEMPILETTERVFKKLVYEWSFDIDKRLKRLWSVLDRQKDIYEIDYREKEVRYTTRDLELWQDNWFPMCTNVYCIKKNG